TPYASVVRAINSEVVNLITNAALLGDSGTNGNGGVITVVSGQAGQGTKPYITVNLGPPAALAAGAGWRVQGDPSYGSVSNYTRQITSGASSVMIEFTNIPGWDAPPTTAVSVTPGQTTIINATYLFLPNLVITPSSGLDSSGLMGGPFAPPSVTY